MALNKYTTTVRFEVLEIEAEDADDVDNQIHNLINQLCDVKTDLTWDFVDWETYELV